MQPMSDEERARPSRNIIKANWKEREVVCALALQLAAEEKGGLEFDYVLRLLRSAYYAGASLILHITAEVSKAVDENRLSEEAAYDALDGLMAEMRDFEANVIAEIGAKIAISRASTQSGAPSNDSNANTSGPGSDASPPPASPSGG